jgi:hypothetical protein
VAAIPQVVENPSAYATLFCTCGWAMAGAQGAQVYCDNPKCKERGKLFNLRITLEEVTPKR